MYVLQSINSIISFGRGRYLSIEMFNIALVNVNLKLQSTLYAQISDGSRQDAFVTHIHIVFMLHELHKVNELKKNVRIREALIVIVNYTISVYH